jgi:diguanylate cyclase (GGDEF)-like protein
MSVRDAAPAREIPADPAALVAAMRRLAVVAERASDPEHVWRSLAHELIAVAGADEVVVHHLDAVRDEEGAGGQGDLVVVYLFGGEGRLSYGCPRAERPAAVSWVASTGRSFLAAGERQLLSGFPRLVRGPSRARCALLAPLVLRGETAAVVALAAREPGRFGAESCEQASTLIEQAATALALVQARVEAGTDAVTGCMNHRAMRRRLQEEIARAGRTGSRLSCMLIDLDDFKLVNDRHGHGAGDAVLREVAQTLMGEFRAFDRVARYGGDEFVVILPETDLDSAAVAAERAIERIRAISVASADEVDASIGVAEWRPPMGVDELLQSCDAALLSGKRAGKRRVTVAR